MSQNRRVALCSDKRLVVELTNQQRDHDGVPCYHSRKAVDPRSRSQQRVETHLHGLRELPDTQSVTAL